MRTRIIAIVTISLLFIVGATVGTSGTSQATTTFTGSTIERIDPSQQTVTFRTMEGQSWTLGLADPTILKREQVSKGDQVSIEIDLNNRITKIVKIARGPRSEPPPSSGPPQTME